MEAQFPHSQVSNKYNQVKTIDVVDALISHGWEVTKYREARVRNADRYGFQKHFVELRPKGSSNHMTVGDSELRVIMSNSHDGTSAYRLQAGLHRLVCSNGLVVSMGDFQHISIRHTAEDIEELAIDGALKIAAMAPKINQTIARMEEVELNPDQQLQFAKEAAAVVWIKKPDCVNIFELIQNRREVDKGSSVWKTYNRIQENITKGGMSINGSRRTTRGIKSPIKDMEVNKDLFELAVKFAA
jgi:hypothetical protein